MMSNDELIQLAAIIYIVCCGTLALFLSIIAIVERLM